MYGTVAKLKAKPGHVEDVIAIGKDEDRDFASIKGALGVFVYRLDSDPDAVVLAVAFEDKATYVANADDPDQDKWYQRLREHLEADPEWMDGDVVYARTAKVL